MFLWNTYESIIEYHMIKIGEIYEGMINAGEIPSNLVGPVQTGNGLPERNISDRLWPQWYKRDV